MSVRPVLACLVAALASVACSKDSDTPPAPPPVEAGLTLAGTFAIDIRGSIDVSSEPGAGTTFSIVLPLA